MLFIQLCSKFKENQNGHKKGAKRANQVTPFCCWIILAHIHWIHKLVEFPIILNSHSHYSKPWSLCHLQFPSQTSGGALWFCGRWSSDFESQIALPCTRLPSSNRRLHYTQFCRCRVGHCCTSIWRFCRRRFPAWFAVGLWHNSWEVRMLSGWAQLGYDAFILLKKRGIFPAEANSLGGRLRLSTPSETAVSLKCPDSSFLTTTNRSYRTYERLLRTAQYVPGFSQLKKSQRSEIQNE